MNTEENTGRIRKTKGLKGTFLMPVENREPMTVLEAYNDLGTTKKGSIKINFLAAFGFTSEDTFYKKIKRETPVKPHERKWLADYLKLPETELFPDPEEKEESNGK
ncbi:MAG: hypothetical protein V4608_03210 [Bacteroidota bacterium]